jgi:zinc and cadmium transporter
MISQIFIAAGAVMLTSLVGVLFTQKVAGALLEKHLQRFVSFAGGVFLVTAVVLMLEVFHLIHSPIEGVLLIAVGYGLAWVMHYFLPESHHHHDEHCAKTAKKLIVGDAIHNIGDGIILVPAFMVSTGLGWAVAISIIIHEVLQEISEFFVLRRAGYSVKKALAVNFAVSSTILIGVGIGLLALATTNLEGLLLALTSGFFLHVVLHDLLFVKSSEATPLKSHLLFVGLGALLMLGVNTALGDLHVHGDHGHGHDDAHHEEEHGHEEEHHH